MSRRRKKNTGHPEKIGSELSVPPLLTMGNPMLAAPSLAVLPETIQQSAFQERLELLAEAMTYYNGIGIAAPQVGWFERVCLMMLTLPTESGQSTDVTDLSDESVSHTLEAWINPVIVSHSDEYCWGWEGCLSVPGLRGWIRRPAAVAVRGLTPSGKPISRELTGWNARVFQHEYDHLEGMLYPYRVLDPRHLVLEEEMAHQNSWPDDWPAVGAKATPSGQLLFESSALFQPLHAR